MKFSPSLHYDASQDSWSLSLSLPKTGNEDRSVRVARSTTTRRGTWKNFDLAPLPRAEGHGNISLSLHYHARRDFENFYLPLPRAAGLRKISNSLHYHARWDFEKFHLPLPRAAGLSALAPLPRTEGL